MYRVCPAVILHGGQSAHLHAPKAVLVANFCPMQRMQPKHPLLYPTLPLCLHDLHHLLRQHNLSQSQLLHLPCHVLLQLLEHNSHLQQQLQELSHATHAAQAPAQASTTTSMQASLLRAALAEANYRLTGAGLLPVAATSLQRSQQQVRGLLHTQHIMYFTWVQPCW